MLLCLMIEGQEGVRWDEWLALALAAEAAGLDALFTSDHYRSIFRGDPSGPLDAWTTLAALAARTERIRLGTLVSPVTFRSASVLAKSVVSVDQISGGRVELGMGAGWFESEHEAYGFAFPSARERFDELERQLAEIQRQLTTADDVWPKSVQKPTPPIIIGGAAKARGVQAAVRFADEYNTPMPTVEEARIRSQVVREAARAYGRDPLRFSMMVDCVVGRDERECREGLRAWRASTGRADAPILAGTIEQVAGLLREYESVGVDRVMLQHVDHADVEMVALFGELAKALSS